MKKTDQTNIEGKKKADDTTKPQQGSGMPEGYEEQEDASFVKFEEIGDSILGKLIVKAKSTRYDFMLYTVKVQNDTLRFHGSQQLDPLLISTEEGDNIYVEYIDNTPTPSGTMKIFKVGIQKQPKRGR